MTDMAKPKPPRWRQVTWNLPAPTVEALEVEMEEYNKTAIERRVQPFDGLNQFAHLLLATALNEVRLARVAEVAKNKLIITPEEAQTQPLNLLIK